MHKVQNSTLCNSGEKSFLIPSGDHSEPTRGNQERRFFRVTYSTLFPSQLWPLFYLESGTHGKMGSVCEDGRRPAGHRRGR